MKRGKRLKPGELKRQGYVFERSKPYIKRRGTRTREWLEFRTNYLKGLPNKVQCHYCVLKGNNRYSPKEKMTLDHRNGRAGVLLTDTPNIVVSCYACNQDKGSTSYIDYVAKIRKDKNGRDSIKDV